MTATQTYSLPSTAELVAPRVSAPITLEAFPQVVNLGLYQGDDVWLALQVTGWDGNPLDLSAAQASAQIRITPASEVLAEFDAQTSGDWVYLHLTHEQATLLTVTNCVWDCQVIQTMVFATPTDVVTTLCYGTVTVRPEVTR